MSANHVSCSDSEDDECYVPTLSDCLFQAILDGDATELRRWINLWYDVNTSDQSSLDVYFYERFVQNEKALQEIKTPETLEKERVEVIRLELKLNRNSNVFLLALSIWVLTWVLSWSCPFEYSLKYSAEAVHLKLSIWVLTHAQLKLSIWSCPSEYSIMLSWSCLSEAVHLSTHSSTHLRWSASAEYLSEYSDGQLQLSTWVSTQLMLSIWSCLSEYSFKYSLKMDSFSFSCNWILEWVLRWTASDKYLSEYSNWQLQMDSLSWVVR